MPETTIIATEPAEPPFQIGNWYQLQNSQIAFLHRIDMAGEFVGEIFGHPDKEVWWRPTGRAFFAGHDPDLCVPPLPVEPPPVQDFELFLTISVDTVVQARTFLEAQDLLFQIKLETPRAVTLVNTDFDTPEIANKKAGEEER